MTGQAHEAGREAGGRGVGGSAEGSAGGRGVGGSADGSAAVGGSAGGRGGWYWGGGPAAPPWFGAAVLALALFAGLVLVGRPAGVGLAVLGVALIAAVAAATRRRSAWWLAAAALAAMPAVRAAGWVQLICLADAAMLASLAAMGGRSGRQVVAGLAAWLAPLPIGAFAALSPLARPPRRALWPALRGGALAALLLAVFVPLFTSADAAFAEIVGRALPSGLNLDRAGDRIAATLAVLALAGALALVARRGPVAPGRPAQPRLSRIEWLLPLGSLLALFAAFVALQLTTLFGGDEHVLRTAGLTYAEYARQGFVQLMGAAALTLGVIAGARSLARDERLLRVLLAALTALTLVVLASALKRLGLYEQAFGFTRLRLVAHAQIWWLAAVLVLAGAAVLSGRSGRLLPHAVVAVSALGALSFAVSNPDGRIAAHNLERYERTGKLDSPYLRGLSADAGRAAGCPATGDGLWSWSLGRAGCRSR